MICLRRVWRCSRSMSTNADVRSSGGGASSLGLGRTHPGGGVSGGEADSALAIDRIAAAIRGAGGDQGLIPTGPERRRLANLSRGWSITIPIVAVVMPIMMAILQHYFDLADLEDLVQTLAFGTNVSGRTTTSIRLGGCRLIGGVAVNGGVSQRRMGNGSALVWQVVGNPYRGLLLSALCGPQRRVPELVLVVPLR